MPLIDSSQRIERLYAWIAVQPDGSEGVVGGHIPGMPGWWPLVGADRARIESFRDIALDECRQSGLPVRLTLFQDVVVLEDLSLALTAPGSNLPS